MLRIQIRCENIQFLATNSEGGKNINCLNEQFYLHLSVNVPVIKSIPFEEEKSKMVGSFAKCLSGDVNKT